MKQANVDKSSDALLPMCLCLTLIPTNQISGYSKWSIKVSTSSMVEPNVNRHSILEINSWNFMKTLLISAINAKLTFSSPKDEQV